MIKSELVNDDVLEEAVRVAKTNDQVVFDHLET